MATIRLIFTVAILVIGAATLGSAHLRRQNGYGYQRYYPQQRTYQDQYPAGQTGVAVDAEWVCKNPKTGDMMVIVAEDAPAGNNNGQGQWQQRPPTGQPGYPQQPNYPQPQQPIYPQPQQPSYPQPQQPTGPVQPYTGQPPIQGTTPNEGAPNEGGEGLIDIRMGQR